MTSLHDPTAYFLLGVAAFVFGLLLAIDPMRNIAVSQDDLHGILSLVACIRA
jgi:hypothetical protein